MADIRFGAATHPGLLREQNEDSFVTDGQVFGVADGMGGHQAGEIASELASQIMRDRLAGGAPSVDVVIATVIEANAAIFQASHSNAGQRGMGTTLTAIVVLRADGQDGDPGEGVERLALVNVGDSRTYLYRDGALRRVTMDHSYVQELVATGHITEAEARTHPRRNIVTRALGIEPSVRVDSWELPLVRGDRFILCSDGLVDEVEDAAIAVVAANMADPQQAAEELVAMANRSGGRDNTTVVVLDVLEGADVGAALPPPLPAADRDVTGPLPGVAIAAAAATIGDDGEPLGQPSASPELEPAPPGRKRITLTQFLVGVGTALVLTLILTFAAVAIFGGDDGDSPAPSTTEPTEQTDVTEPSDTTDEPATTQPTTQPPRTTVPATTPAATEPAPVGT